MSSGSTYMNPLDGTSEYHRSQFRHQRNMAGVRTMMPVKVIKVYKADMYPPQTMALQGEVAKAGLLDCQPVVSQVDGGGQSMQHQIIYGVPYNRIYGGTNALIMDPVKGDIGYITVGDRDVTSFWKSAVGGGQQGGLGGDGSQDNSGGSSSSAGPGTSGGGGIMPGSQRRFNPSDSVYVGGVLNQVPKQYITFMANGIQIQDANKNTIVLSNGSASDSSTAKLFGSGQATGKQAKNTNTGVKGITITDMNNNNIQMRKNDSGNLNGMIVMDFNGNKIEMRKGDNSNITGIVVTDTSGNKVEMRNDGSLKGIRTTDINNNVIVTNPGGVSVTTSGTMTVNAANLFATGDVVAQWSQAGLSNVSLTAHTHGGITSGGAQTAVPTPGT